MARKNRSILIGMLFFIMVNVISAAPASAHWGTSRHIHVSLKSDNWYFIAWNPHINPATISVYGPNGYFRSAYFSGWSNALSGGRTVGYVFDNAPTGNYRMRVQWAAGYDSKAQEANQYGSLGWWERADAYTFQSP